MSKVPMENIPVVYVPYKCMTVDLTGPMEPASEAGHRYILTLVDYATKYSEAVPLKRIESNTVAEVLLDIYSRLSVPGTVYLRLHEGSMQASWCHIVYDYTISPDV